NPPRNAGLSQPVAIMARDGDHQALTAQTAAGMEQAGLPATAGRAAADSAPRLVEPAHMRSARPTGASGSALQHFLAMAVPLAEAVTSLQIFSDKAGLSLAMALADFSARADAMARHGLPLDSIRYDAAFGRPLDYYTGLVFEIAIGPGERAL